MAQGLIQHSSSTGAEELEDISIHYFDELWSRCFFQDVEEDRPLFTSVCKMHDLIHDLVLPVAKTDYMVISSHLERVHKEVRHVAFSSYEQSGKELPRSLL